VVEDDEPLCLELAPSRDFFSAGAAIHDAGQGALAAGLGPGDDVVGVFEFHFTSILYGASYMRVYRVAVASS